MTPKILKLTILQLLYQNVWDNRLEYKGFIEPPQEILVFIAYVPKLLLAHLSLASFLWDKGKQ